MESVKKLLPAFEPKTAEEKRAERRERRRNAAAAIVRHEKRKARRRFRKRYVWPVVHTLFIFCCGALIGIHRNVIKAAIKGEPLPKGPHPWCK